jgi:hypothetical protein
VSVETPILQNRSGKGLENPSVEWTTDSAVTIFPLFSVGVPLIKLLLPSFEQDSSYFLFLMLITKSTFYAVFVCHLFLGLLQWC